MYEYRTYNTKTKEEKILFGHTFENACKRADVNPAEYVVVDMEYVD